MKAEEISKELWSLANIVTGFSVAQYIAATLALGKDLTDIQHLAPFLKLIIVVAAAIFSLSYCFAVQRCGALALSVDATHSIIWRNVTRGRILCILLFTCLFVFGLFAPEIFPEQNTEAKCHPPI